MYNLIRNSFFLSLIYDFFIFLNRTFKESYIYSLFFKMTIKFNLFLDNSRIWSYFFRRDRLDSLWPGSEFVQLINSILNFPARLFRKLYLKYQEAFSVSWVFRFLSILADKIHLLIGLGLIFTVIIPDHIWYNAYSVLFVLIIALVFVFKSVVDEDFKFDLGELDFIYIVFMIAIALSALLSLFPRASLSDLVFYIISFISVLVLVNSIDSSEDLNQLVEILVFGVFLTALYGVYQWKVVGIAVDPSLTDITINKGMSGRVFSTMGNPNIYGELLVLTMPFFIAAFLNTDSIIKKIFFTGAFVLTTVVLFKTGSRSSWLAIAGAFMTFIFFKDKKLIIPMLGLGFLALPFLPDSIYRRMMTIFNSNDSSLRYRKQILEPAVPMLRKYWITGVGLGTEAFNIIYKRYKSLALTTVAHTHNLFLQIWLESGILALVSLLLLGFRLVKKTTYVFRNGSDPKLKNIVGASIGAIAGLMVMGFADHVWFYNRILFIFWIVVAFIFIAIKLVYREEEEIEETSLY